MLTFSPIQANKRSYLLADLQVVPGLVPKLLNNTEHFSQFYKEAEFAKREACRKEPENKKKSVAFH